MYIMGNQLDSFVGVIKSKVKALKKMKSPLSLKKKRNYNRNYIKMEKSASVKVAFRTKKARKHIDKTLEKADSSPGESTIS
ncbi:uncharacterized protein LOC110739991 [Chenopodium quinoa]|uniref:uncharacterized protein LOC110739991 n=1 Tax=Chenopodium quinoa TaxID=63459 RepID=UPI000B796C59|nr:uncharacterized protein LOC110739991 [Chenopodium quinoa]